MPSGRKSTHPPVTLDNSTLRSLLVEYSKGEIKTTNKGFLVCCPWHEDQNPSCVVFFKTGNFHCFLCHGDQPKGHRGASAYKGFIKLGMPKERAQAIFLSGKADTHIDPNLTPSLDSFDVTIPKLAKKPNQRTNQVLERKPWPKFWGFRELLDTTMTAPWFLERFEPMWVLLKRERHPRIALAIGGAESTKNTKAKGYLRQEVYLRLNSAVRNKAVNTYGLNLDPEVKNPIHATLFGLVNNQLSKDCRGLILVEGPYDGLHLLQHIHGPEIGGGFDVVSLLGTPQFDNCLNQLYLDIIPELVQRNIPIILAFDNDKAGYKLTKAAAEAFQTKCYLPEGLLKILPYPRKIKDPGLLSLATFIMCLEQLGFDLQNKMLIE